MTVGQRVCASVSVCLSVSAVEIEVSHETHLRGGGERERERERGGRRCRRLGQRDDTEGEGNKGSSGREGSWVFVQRMSERDRKREEG